MKFREMVKKKCVFGGTEVHKALRRWEYTVHSSTRQSPLYPQQACDQFPQHPFSASPSKFLTVSLNVRPYFISYLYSFLKTSLRTIFAYAYKCGICVCGVCIHMCVNTLVWTHSVYVVSMEAPGQHHVSSVCLYFIYWGRVSHWTWSVSSHWSLPPWH